MAGRADAAEPCAAPRTTREVPVPVELVQALHASPQRVVLEVAGAGSQAVAWLHAVSGSSRTVLEATDRYSPASLASLLGVAPAQAVTGDVAAAMAAAALRRARLLAGLAAPVVGAACTGALITDRRRRGAHHAIVAVADALGTTVTELQLDKGARTRQQEEAAASLLLLSELAAACAVPGPLPSWCQDAPQGDSELLPSAPFAALGSGTTDWLLLDAAGRLVNEAVCWERTALLSGAYQPLHAGHLALADAAATALGREVVFELPLVNADKAPLALRETRRRAAQFAGRASVVLSRVPLFSGKAALFPGVVFVVGADTAARVIDPRFYGGSRAAMQQAIAAVARRGCSFLVAGRRIGGRYTTLADLDLRLPPPLRGLFRELPEDSFRYDISSSEIRARGTAAHATG